MKITLDRVLAKQLEERNINATSIKGNGFLAASFLVQHNTFGPSRLLQPNGGCVAIGGRRAI